MFIFSCRTVKSNQLKGDSVSLYSISRILISVLLLAVCIFVIKKKISFNKQRLFTGIAIFCCFCVAAVLELIPYENSFISFDTPEKAIQYYSNNDIENILYGKDTCLVLTSGKSNTRQILNKKNKGWNIQTEFNIKKTNMKPIGTDYAYILSIEESTDRYILVRNVSGKELELYDNLNSEFTQANTGEYYAYLSDFSDEYILYVDGEEVRFASEQAETISEQLSE